MTLAGGWRLFAGWALACLVLLAVPAATRAAADETAVPREILSVYYHEDGRSEARLSPLHRRGEAVLNHLGLTVRHHNLALGLPPPEALAGARGVVAWFETSALPDPEGFINWATAVAASGRKLVLAGNWAFSAKTTGEGVAVDAINRLLGSIGLYTNGTWVPFTYGYEEFSKDNALVPFEGAPGKPYPPFSKVYPASSDTRVLLSLSDGKGSGPLVMAALSPAGGYLGPDIMFKRGGDAAQLQWVINPLEFFRLAFATDDLPKPDVTTLSGRRIYYSHVDGDGWNNLSEIKNAKGEAMTAAEVIRDQIVAPFPDLPVTIAPIAADLDPSWRGTRRAVAAARSLFDLPQVEAGSHTYSHPFSWGFYQDGGDRDAPFRARYTGSASQAQRIWMKLTGKTEDIRDIHPADSGHRHLIPRAYFDQPFSLDQEIGGSARFIDTLLPPGKRVELLQWSGDTSPFEAAIAAAEAAGLANINGGDTRFDAEYPSIAWVAPVGQRVGRQIQIYSSNSNENTYTNLWTDRFFGFRYLTETIVNTGSPIRLKPFNLYYHTYSGEKLASRNALLANLQVARESSLAPIAASRYARIAQGFFTARLVRLGEGRWRVEDRGALQTIRFDHATLKAVDMERSPGVIGQTHFHGSLYVALDETSPAPIIALTDLADTDRPPAAARPYLVESRWRVWNLRGDADGGVSATVQGFGRGDMTWRVPVGGPWSATLAGAGGTTVARAAASTDADGLVTVALPAAALEPMRLSLGRTTP